MVKDRRLYVLIFFFLCRKKSAIPEIVLGPLRTGKRPFIFIAELIDSSYKQFHRRLIHDTCINAFEPVIVPAQVFRRHDPVRQMQGIMLFRSG